MGFENLILVQPQCEVGMEARSFAMKGSDILNRAVFLPSLESATERVGLIVGTTARYQGRNPNAFTPKSFLQDVLPDYSTSSLGVVIGSEDNGLRRDELRFCNWMIEIPTASTYPVINLAQAAAIVAYELNLFFDQPEVESTIKKPESCQIEPLLARIDETLNKLNLTTRLSVDRLMLRIREITARSQLDREDINMLHGLLKEIQKLTSS